MRAHFLCVPAVVLWCVAFPAAAQSERSAERAVESAEPMPAGFDPAQSAAVFIGIRQFTHDPELTEVRYAADDAIDLAYALAVDRSIPLVYPPRVVLALSGEPQKAESRQHLQRLRAGGAAVEPAGQSDIIALLERQSRSVGPKGILLVSIATHGFSEGGQNYLLAASSLLRHHETALLTSTVFEIAATPGVPRSLIFIDACRQRLVAGARALDGPDARAAAPLLEAVGRASGQVVFYAAAPGQYAYDDDDRKNGVFTAAVLDGLRCSAPADPRGLITVATLADYVDKRVVTWVKEHRERNARGIQVTTDGGGRAMGIAMCRTAVPVAGTEPARIRMDENTLSVWNAAGAHLWSASVRGKIIDAQLADLDGDGTAEVIAGVAGNGEDVGRVFVYDRLGNLRWSADTTAKYNYDGPGSGRMVVRAFTTGDLFRNGTRQLVTLSLDSQGWYPSRLCIFSADGSLLSSYWHPGHLHHVLIGAPDVASEPRIIVTGINNSLRPLLHVDGYVSTVFVLDPRKVAGEAPPYTGHAGRGTELWYGVLLPVNQPVERLELVDADQDGEKEISVWTASRNVFNLSFDGRLLAQFRGDGGSGVAATFRLLQGTKLTP